MIKSQVAVWARLAVMMAALQTAHHSLPVKCCAWHTPRMAERSKVTAPLQVTCSDSCVSPRSVGKPDLVPAAHPWFYVQGLGSD